MEDSNNPAPGKNPNPVPPQKKGPKFNLYWIYGICRPSNRD